MNKRENVFSAKQSLITNFYELISDVTAEVDRLLKENQYLKKLLEDFRGSSDMKKSSNKNSSEFLTKIWEVVERKSKTKHGHIAKYDEKLKQFCAYLYVIAGRMTCETISANLLLPSVPTVKKAIQSSNNGIIEGSLRVEELNAFLLKWKLHPQVWLSEDATKIVNKIQYDESADQIVGLVLPMDSKGMPIQFSYKAENVAKMQSSILNHSKADYVYTVMARSLNVHAPAFCLSLFGTDNKFKTSQVLKRWTHTENLLRSRAVNVLGWSSDGDTRCLRAMMIRSDLASNPTNVPVEWRDWFNASYKPATICVQDHHHICNKLRIRLYDNTAVIVLGNYVVTKSHLKILIDTVSKDKHLLVPSDLNPHDKMNFKPVLKLMNPEVRSHLKHSVHASLGTSIYIRLIENVYISYLDEKLTPLERVYHLWYTIFFLRIWRRWLVEHKKFSLKNFIAYNTYACIELNGHSLINTIVKLAAAGQDDQFVTVLMGSQTCEEFFRSLRSLTSTYWTSVNFTLLEMLYKVKRIDFQHEAMADLNSEFKFPRLNLKKFTFYKLPTESEIGDAVRKAQNDALKDITELGIKIQQPRRQPKTKPMVKTNKKSIFACQLSSIRLKPEEREDFDVDDEFFEDECDYDVSDTDSDCESLDGNKEVQQHEYDDSDDEEKKERDRVPEDIGAILEAHGESINLKEYSNVKESAEKLHFLVTNATGDTVRFKKKNFCWLLNGEYDKLSNDRVLRFQGKKTSKPQTGVSPNIQSSDKPIVNTGDWCQFDYKRKKIVGQVLGFIFLDKKTKKESRHSLSYASASDENVGVLGNWFIAKANKFKLEMIADFIPIKFYLKHVEKPDINLIS